MKYLKRFEVEYNRMIFAKDYVSNNFNYFDNSKHQDIYDDLEKLKKLKINYETYYYVDNVAIGLLFKVFIKDYLNYYDIKCLKRMNFHEQDLNYKFTFNWNLINEDDIEFILNSNKYNL